MLIEAYFARFRLTFSVQCICNRPRYNSVKVGCLLILRLNSNIKNRTVMVFVCLFVVFCIKAAVKTVKYSLLFNSTECLARLGMRPLFVSSIGSDPLGAMLLKHCEEARMVHLFWVMKAEVFFVPGS